MAEQFEKSNRSAADQLKCFFTPSSVALIGASRQRGTIGAEILHNMISFGYTGKIYPVNPAASEIQGLACYAKMADIPAPIELAVITVPAVAVEKVVAECGQKGVQGLVIISSGFSEVGPEGLASQQRVMKICQQFGMRLIGPNCMGISNTNPEVKLNATFAPEPPSTGRVGFLTQSGALGLAIIDYAREQGLGLSSFFSVGNKADVSSNDVLQYWENDPRTDIVLLYLESFGNPRKFARIARRVTRTKPILALKSGRSLVGARAAASHTGALLGASDKTVDALFRQCGVIRTATLEELIDTASVLAHQPPPRGRRVAVITNAGGPGIMCADACEAYGLQLPELSESLRRSLAGYLPPQASLRNPIDMIASASPEQFRRTIEIVGASQEVDSLIVIYIPPIASDPRRVAAEILQGARTLQGTKPIVSVFMSSRSSHDLLRTTEQRIPTFLFPESAVLALSHAIEYGEWQRREQTEPPPLNNIDGANTSKILSESPHSPDGWLDPEGCRAVLESYGIPCIKQRGAKSALEAGKIAAQMGCKVALKGVAPSLVHKSDVGGVVLGLQGESAVREAAETMQTRLKKHGHALCEFILQEMAPEGTEIIVGGMQDALFGPVLLCGAGGVMSEILNDVAVRLPPLTTLEARSMLKELRSYRLLTGYRGSPAARIEALEDILLRVGRLIDEHPEISEIDCNPVRVSASGALVLDSRIKLKPLA